MKISNSFGTKFSGALGKDLVAVRWHGHEYIRVYAVASNPNSERQKAQRGAFAEAMSAWKTLSESQQEFYRRIADGMTGHNLFISRYFESRRVGREPETPRRMWWVAADGQPILGGRLMVMKQGCVIFDRNLRGATVEIALTASDTPYAIFLVKGLKGDKVLANCRPAFIENPQTLESKSLGMKLLVAGPPVRSPPATTIRKRLGIPPSAALMADDVTAPPPGAIGKAPAEPDAQPQDSTGS